MNLDRIQSTSIVLTTTQLQNIKGGSSQSQTAIEIIISEDIDAL